MFQSKLKPIKQLIQKLISIMLFLDIDGLVVIVQIIQTEILRYYEYSLSVSQLVYYFLELGEEINVFAFDLGADYTISECVDLL